MSTLSGALHEQTLSLLPLADAATALRDLKSAGWAATDTDTTIRVSWSGSTGVGSRLAELESLRTAFIVVEATGSCGQRELRLRDVGSTMEVVEVPQAPPEALFENPADLEAADRAWDLDPDAALSLPMRWNVTAELALERLLTSPSSLEIRVVLTAETIRRTFLRQRLRTAEQLIPASGKRRIYLALDTSAQPVHLGGLTFAGLVNLPTDGNLVLPSAAVPPAGESTAKAPPAGLPTPTALVLDRNVPAEVQRPWEDVINRCQALAALATWVMMANNVELIQDDVRLEILGFKRVILVLPDPSSLSSARCVEALDLRAWAFQDGSPDRLLALRQVISLYQDEDAFAHAADIRDSAEVIYAGLRSEAVAEVIKSSREAQNHAQETVRQSLKSAQELIKSATERFLAALVAVAAVLIANVSRTLPDDISRNLLLLVAAFLGILAFFAIVVEGPLLHLPLKNLNKDLRNGTALLTESQRRKVTGMASVASTRFRVSVVRFIIPTLHLTLAALIILFGDPGAFK